MIEQRLLLAALAAYAIIRMFPKAHLENYKALDYGFNLTFFHKEKLDDLFLRHLEDSLAQNPELYPMTMLGANAATLLRHQGQELLAETLPAKGLVEMVKIADTVLPGPHCPLEKLAYKFLALKKTKEGAWQLEAAVFRDKAALKDFMKLYSQKERFDPFLLACQKGLVTKEGLWREKGIALLEEIRRGEEHFWQKRGFERVFLGEAGPLPEKAVVITPILDKPLNTNMLEYGPLRLWAYDKTKSLHLAMAGCLACLGKAQETRRQNLYLADPLGAFYETASVISSKDAIAMSLFYSPVQALGFLLQKTRGDLEALQRLQKEMFEFSK